jgi:hypothetical protein
MVGAIFAVVTTGATIESILTAPSGAVQPCLNSQQGQTKTDLKEFLMRNLLLLGALAGATMLTSSPSPATDGPWCLRTRLIDCSLPSYDECRFTASPESGYCYRNPHYGRPARMYEAMAHRGSWGGYQESWWAAPAAYARPHGPRVHDSWASYEPEMHHGTYRHSHVDDFWYGFQPVMLRMPPSEGTQSRWCLTIKYTTCSIPTYEVCRFAASPESGYCWPNPYYHYREAHGIHYMARAHARHHHRGDMAAAAHAGTPGVKAAAAEFARAGVNTAALDAKALAELVAQAKDVAGTYGAFAMVNSTPVTTPVPDLQPAALPSTGQEPVKVASLTPNIAVGTATPATTKPAAPRKPAAAGGVPAINVMPSCRAAANAMIGVQQDVNICLQSENSAREQLAKEWAVFEPAERSSCVGLTTMGGGGTYTELLTCLDLKLFARNIHKDDPAVRVARQ